MSYSLENDSDDYECPYTALLRELDSAYRYASVSDHGDTYDSNAKYHRPQSAFEMRDFEVSSEISTSQRIDSADTKRRSIRWKDHRESTIFNVLKQIPKLPPPPPPPPPSSPSSSRERSSSQGSDSEFSDETEVFESPRQKPPRRPPKIPPKKEKEADEGARANVASFKRSLRLLGLSPTDLGITSPGQEQYTQNTPKRRCCSGSPRARLSTRLTRKSVSLEDVRKATPLMTSDADAHRLVANAVYEEWYFGKKSEILKKKREEEEEERRKAEKEAMQKEEVRRKSEAKFQEWLQRKLQEKRESRNMRDSTSAQAPRSSHQSRLAVTPEKAEEAYHKWLKEKEKQRREKGRVGGEAGAGVTRGDRRGTLAARRHTDPERKEEAHKVYEHWKKETEEARKKEIEKRRRKEEKEEAAKQKKELEQLENARRSFESWKRRKDEEIRKQQERKRLAEQREKQRQEEKKWQRSESASKAFLAWLDAVDERSIRNASSGLSTNASTATCSRQQAAF